MSKKLDYFQFIETINSNGFTTHITEKEYIRKYQGKLQSNNKLGEKIPVICYNGHKTYKWYQNIKYGYGCVVCGNNRKKIKKSLTAEHVKNILQIDGFKLLSPYVAAHDKITILCPNNHIFKKQWANYQQGERCPICNNKGRSIPEKVISSFLSYNNIYYDMQKPIVNPYNTKTKLFFDFFIPSLSLIIEYDGEQHFSSSTHSIYKPNKKYDDYKNYWCKVYNLNLIRIDSRTVKTATDICKIISSYMEKMFNLLTLTPDSNSYLAQNIDDKKLCDFMDEYGIYESSLKFKLKGSALRDRYYFFKGKKYYSEKYLNKINKSSKENKEYIVNFYIHHSLKETSEKFSVSTSFIGTTFKEFFGLSKRDYLLKIDKIKD